MINGLIYKIEFPNGKNYIGLTTTSLEQRKREHKSCAKNSDTKCLYNALRKYDMIDTFELIQIDTADTIEELCEKEMKYIFEYNSYYQNKNGYNMTYGGEGNNGYVCTEEDRKKISESQKKRFENPNEIQKISEAAIKRFEDPEERIRHSVRMKQRIEDNPELKKKFSESQKERFKDPQEKDKISEAKLKFYKENPDEGQKHSEKMKQHYKNNPQSKEQMREIKNKLYKNNPELRQICSERTIKYYKNHPEAGTEHSEKMKKRFEENPQHKKIILDTKGQNKPFDIFKLNGEFIKTFNYQFEAKEYLQKEHNITTLIKIGAVLSENRKSSAGFIFKYK